MKTPHLLPLCLLASLVPLCASPVDSRISAATVYADRAVVTRIAQVELAAGEHALLFERLPANLVDQSLQVSGHGTAAATILDVNAQTAYVDFTPNERVQELEEQIRNLLKQGRALNDRTDVLKEERDFVKRMLVAATGAAIYSPGADAAHGGIAPARPTLDEWQKLYAYADETLGKIAAECQSLDSQREDLKVKQAALEQQLNELRGARGKSFKNVTVRVAVATAGTLEIAVKYAVPGANWAPSYDARLRAADSAVELTYFGLVRNGTGEDWNDIALTLSTARPSLGGGAPELAQWVVDVAQPMSLAKAEGGPRSAMAAARAQTIGAPANAQQFLDEAEEPSIAGRSEIALSHAAVEAGATSATFKIPVYVSVPADNTMQKVSIASAKLSANLQYQATPRIMETAFLSAHTVNNTAYPFLAGAMNTFLDDTFVAASRLKTVMPGEKLELQFGADEGIAIRQKVVNRFAENTGLTNNGRRITYEYLVTITNNKAKPEHVVFKESMPVSRNEKIEVNLLAPDEKDVGTKENPKEVTREENGKLVWSLDVKPAEKRECSFKFSVEYPADANVYGLE